MPHELDRIKQLAGLQQEAPAVGLTAPQKQGLAALVKKYAKRKTYGGGGLISGYLDYLAQTGIWTDAADEKEFDVALKKLGHDDLDAWEQDAEGEEFEQFLELAPITAQSQNDVEKVLGKGFENNTTLINAASDYVKSLPETEESAVAEAPGAEINKSTMPHELDRIKELAGLQQEAAAITPNQIEAFKKWYATYSKMQSKDVYNYAKGIFKAYMVTGVTNLDGASKQDPKGKAYDDLAKIFPEMDGDIEAIGHALQKQGVDPLDMEAMAGQESAVAEAPVATAFSANQIEAFKKWYATYSKMQSKDVYNYAKGIFKAHMETGQTDLDGESKQDPKGKAYDDLAKIFPEMDGDIEAIGEKLRNQGVDPTDMEAEEDEDNIRLKLKSMSGQESISQVDESIKKARAQIETLEAALKEDYKKFQGLKPYKPKKK